MRAIYEEGLATDIGSFEAQAPSREQWHAARLPHSRLVSRGGDAAVFGRAALSPVSQPACYVGVAEVGIYVATGAGQGVAHFIGSDCRVCRVRAAFWALQVRLLRMEASLALQTRCGSRIVGRRERIAQRDRVWHHSILTERRSGRSGRD